MVVTTDSERLSLLKKVHDFICPILGDGCRIEAMRNDASMRQYYRVSYAPDHKTYVVMYSPIDFYWLHPFLYTTKVLRSLDMSVPEIYSVDHANGMVLLEDFGVVSANIALKSNADNEEYCLSLYKIFIDVLITIENKWQYSPYFAKNSFNINLPERLLSELRVYVRYYVNRYLHKETAQSDLATFYKLWTEALFSLHDYRPTISMFDYHVDNIMILDRPGCAGVGLLDYQDAMVGTIEYDLVSLIEDARRDMPHEFRKKLIEYYLSEKVYTDHQQFYDFYNMLGLQRNLRILGVFVRKVYVDKDDSYMPMVSRVRGYIEESIQRIQEKTDIEALRNVCEFIITKQWL